ncbi:CD99 antigen-like protein 2 isoform X2 [Amia ocellicauda]|uniref:CD99 antigen-like protein 2 isoform X2 n=1 Tax=Amia ocellicauda TaxID=2972642 RepID=UPI0034642B56
MMAKLTAWSLLAVFAFLALKGSAQDFDLADALVTDKPSKPSTPKPPVKPAGGDTDFGLLDFDTPAKKTTTRAPKVTSTTKAPMKPKPKPNPKPGLKPGAPTTIKPRKISNTAHKGKPAGEDFDLSDALDDKNDMGGKDKNNKGDGKLSDDDLFDLSRDDGYSPDKKKGGSGPAPSDDTNYDTTAETGTIAGIASALAMALIGAVSSYVSYQQKKFCFRIQEGLNAEYVKGDNLEAVVAQEPQAEQTLLQHPSSEPPIENKV